MESLPRATLLVVRMKKFFPLISYSSLTMDRNIAVAPPTTGNIAVVSQTQSLNLQPGKHKGSRTLEIVEVYLLSDIVRVIASCAQAAN
jgi:hypothetical protein